MRWSSRASLIALIVMTPACGDPGGAASSDATALTPGTPTASATVDGPVRVPDLTGLTGRAAARELRAVGLRPRLLSGDGSACLPPGVLRQRPKAGRLIDPRTRVRVEVNSAVGECGIDLPPATAELAGIARSFIHFANGGQLPQFSDEIGLHLGNRLIDSAPASSLAAPEVWRICPPEGGYAAFVCPFSARDHVARWQGRLAVTSLAASHPCAHPSEPPTAWSDLRRVTITPDESLSCPSYWAVELYVDDCDRINAVNLVRSEP